MARILVIDADAPVRALTRRILVMDNHDVIDVADAANAIAAMNLNRFDLVLVDVELPDEDGYDLLDTLRARDEAISIIVTSARDEAQGSLREGRAGVIDHIIKPFGFGQLRSAVKRVLESDPEALRELRVIRSTAAERYGPVINLEEKAKERRGLRLRRR